MILLFEKFSWLHFFVLLPVIKKCLSVYILKPHPHNELWTFDIEKIAKRVKWFSPGLPVQELGHEDFPKECFKANCDLVEFVERREDRICGRPIVRRLKKLLKDERVCLAMKKRSVDSYRNTYYLAMMAHALSGKEDKKVYVVPNGRDWLGLFDEFERLLIHPQIRFVNILIDQVRSLYFMFRFLGYLLLDQGGLRGLLLSSLSKPFRKDNKRGNKPFQVKYAVQVQWPFHKGTERRSGKRQRWDNSFLEDGKEFSGKNLLYSYYRPDIPIAEDMEFHESRNVRYCEEATLPATWQYYLGGMISPSLRMLALFMWEWIRFRTPSDLTRSLVSLLNSIHRYERFAIHFRPKVYVGFDDQELSCIARSIAFKKYEIRSVGVPHSSFGGPLIMPGIAYSSFDRLCTPGKIWRQMFAPFWDDLVLDSIGSLRSDLVFQSISDSHRKMLFSQKYGNDCKKILVACGGIGGQNLEGRYVEFFKTLQRLVKIRRDVKIILRPRNQRIPEPRHKKLIMEGLESGQIVIEMDDFDTWELIAYCDLVITAATSAMINESLDSGKAVLSFIFNGLDELHPFHDSNSMLLATSGKELMDRINCFLDQGRHIANYKDLQLEYARAMDGKVIERLRDAMREMAGQECK